MTTQTKLRKLEEGELQSALCRHEQWVDSDEGDPIDLSGVDLSGVSLSRANLTGGRFVSSRLTGANLSGATLVDVDMSGADLSWADLTAAAMDRTNLSGANLTGVNLTGVNLLGVDLFGIDLGSANLTEIRGDVRSILRNAPDEVPYLLGELRRGNVDGRFYHRACACLVGTLNRERRRKSVFALIGDMYSPAERWATAIIGGNTPQTCQICRITEEWIVEFLDELG
jgi:hypothetical protein